MQIAQREALTEALTLVHRDLDAAFELAQHNARFVSDLARHDMHRAHALAACPEHRFSEAHLRAMLRATRQESAVRALNAAAWRLARHAAKVASWLPE